MFFNSYFAGVFLGCSMNLGFPCALLIGCHREMIARGTLCWLRVCHLSQLGKSLWWFQSFWAGFLPLLPGKRGNCDVWLHKFLFTRVSDGTGEVPNEEVIKKNNKGRKQWIKLPVLCCTGVLYKEVIYLFLTEGIPSLHRVRPIIMFKNKVLLCPYWILAACDQLTFFLFKIQ